MILCKELAINSDWSKLRKQFRLKRGQPREDWRGKDRAGWLRPGG